MRLNGRLRVGVVAIVHLQVANTGSARTGDLTASLALPAGLRYAGMGGSQPQAWTCSASSQGATCTHGPIGPNIAAPAAIEVVLVDLTGCGSPVLATVVSDGISASAQSGAIACQ